MFYKTLIETWQKNVCSEYISAEVSCWKRRLISRTANRRALFALIPTSNRIRTPNGFCPNWQRRARARRAQKSKYYAVPLSSSVASSYERQELNYLWNNSLGNYDYCPGAVWGNVRRKAERSKDTAGDYSPVIKVASVNRGFSFVFPRCLANSSYDFTRWTSLSISLVPYYPFFLLFR